MQPIDKGYTDNSVRIYYETFGDPQDPAVLLLTGMDDQCTSWPPFFYEPIVNAGLRGRVNNSGPNIPVI